MRQLIIILLPLLLLNCTAQETAPLPPMNSSSNTLGELLGVNAYWGWGQNQYSFLSKPEFGPALYAPIVSHARNYHDMTWDINVPNESPNYTQMRAGKGTTAKNWLDWDREYSEWKKYGIDIQASIQIANFTDKQWTSGGKTAYQNAYDYGFAFASHFGKTKGNGSIDFVEIGNEPWKYDAAIYSDILHGMVAGIRKADAEMTILPCALQNSHPDNENSDWEKNYLPARIPTTVIPKINGLNVHCYSTTTDFFGNRTGVHPEHPNSTFWEMQSTITWRDKYMPAQKIYLSEWGWDHAGGGEDCMHGDCVSEAAAAAYAVRGALIAHGLGMERATWFYFANEEKPSDRFTRSGLTSSKAAGFKKKSTYYAFQDMQEKLGDYSFIKSEEKDGVYCFYYGKRGTATHLVSWLPIDYENKKTKKVQFSMKKAPSNISYFPAKMLTKKSPPSDFLNGKLILKVSSHPVLVELN